VTERLYYTDPCLVEFDARVLESSFGADGRGSIVLDRTAFYPTSGGQPHDTGTLGDARVVDVIDRDDGTIVHCVEGGFPAGPVHGCIDWCRRFEHMQQHTGQHVLSAAFDRLLGVRTVSFHLGSSSSTIDLDREISAQDIARAESEANRIVWENRPVTIRFVDSSEAAKLPLRKEPVREGPLRLIEVEGFDVSACGGTHVARTGAIGIIAMGAAERLRGGTRVEFFCGVRALRDYRSIRTTVTESARLLSIMPAELPAAIERLQAECRDARRTSKDLRTALAAFEAEALAASAERHGGLSLVARAMDGWDAHGLKLLASQIAGRPGFVVVLISSPAPSAIVVARSAGLNADSAAILKALTMRFGGKGGGRPELAQGGGLSGAPAEMAEAARSVVLRHEPS
jgi:alanyl-tRNA synthetase